MDWAFKTAYALGFLAIGYVIDRVGTRLGLALGMTVWSFAGILSAFTVGVKSMSGARFLLGLGEASIFPSSVKAISEWFPKHERTLATGLFNAGTNVGVILTAFAVPLLTLYFGWRASFFITGALGCGMLVIWWRSYCAPAQHPRITNRGTDVDQRWFRCRIDQ